MKLFELTNPSPEPVIDNGVTFSDTLSRRIDDAPWDQIEAKLATRTHSLLPQLLSQSECDRMRDLYETGEFRSRVVMERYAFGRGEYKYFSYPLPNAVRELRTRLYAHLAPIANRWHHAMKIDEQFPATHEEFLAVCDNAGQRRPTPLMLRYSSDDYCCLHQDLYGDHVFPFQVVFLLSEPGADFTGGELLLTETAPKKNGLVDVVPLRQGQAVIVPVNFRPVSTMRGSYRSKVRHGVSKLRSGSRNTLGIIFHDAK